MIDREACRAYRDKLFYNPETGEVEIEGKMFKAVLNEDDDVDIVNPDGSTAEFSKDEKDHIMMAFIAGVFDEEMTKW